MAIIYTRVHIVLVWKSRLEWYPNWQVVINIILFCWHTDGCRCLESGVVVMREGALLYIRGNGEGPWERSGWCCDESEMWKWIIFGGGGRYAPYASSTSYLSLGIPPQTRPLRRQRPFGKHRKERKRLGEGWTEQKIASTPFEWNKSWLRSQNGAG